MIKISKYSIRSEAAIHGCTIKKAALKSFKNFTGKTLCMSLFLNKVAGLRPEVFFKKRLLYTCFPVSFAKYFRAPFLQSTSGWLLLQNILLFFTLTSATKYYQWSCFPFLLQVFSEQHLSFLKVLNMEI